MPSHIKNDTYAASVVNHKICPSNSTTHDTRKSTIIWLYFTTKERRTNLMMTKSKNISISAFPTGGKKGMIMHGFEPIEGSIDQFLEFWERLEVTEGI